MVKRLERGRSMLEMLAVLIIVGVLSIAGFVGYRFMTEKNVSNAVSREISMRVITCATQFSGGDSECNLSEFDSGPGVDGAEISPDVYVERDKNMFILGVHGVSQNMCR